MGSRLLVLAGWLLPAARREWADAMAAELGLIPSRTARRRFVAGCIRAILQDAAGTRLRLWLTEPAWLTFALLGGILLAVVDRASANRTPMWVLLGMSSAALGWCRPVAA